MFSYISHALRLWEDIEREAEGGGASARCEVLWGQVKKLDRAVNKIAVFCQGRVSRLCDLVRQRIVFNSLNELHACVEAIQNDPELQIVRVKNRFDTKYAAQTTAGYRDVVLTVRVCSDDTRALGLSCHGAELQLAHRDMAQHLSAAQHARYLQYKSVMLFIRTTPGLPHKPTTARVFPFMHAGLRNASRDVQTRGSATPPATYSTRGSATPPATNRTCQGCAGVKSHLSAEDWAQRRELAQRMFPLDEVVDCVELRNDVTMRGFEVLNLRCSYQGGVLQARLLQTNQEMQQVDILCPSLPLSLCIQREKAAGM